MPPLALIPNRPDGESDILSYGYGSGATPTRTASYTSTAAQQRDLENMLAEQKRQNDREFQQKQDKIDNDYRIAKQNARTAKESAAVDKWYKQQSIKNAQAALAQENRHFELRLEFDRQVHADELGLNQARLGYDVLGLQAQYGRGAENYFQASELARNVAAQPGTATFLNALKNNTNLTGFGAQAGAPVRADINNLSMKLGGPNLIPGTGTTTTASSAPLSNDDANLSAIRDIGLAGAHKLGAGVLERLTDTELKLLQSGLDYIGVDTPTFMNQYRRSRVSQGLGNVSAA